MNNKPVLAVIGGSGLYDMPGLQNKEEQKITTPFGDPSAPIITGNLDGLGMAFLARHGIGHYLSPSEINYRANIYALKTIGVERILSISACGSLREDFAPGEIVIPDQLFDFTRERKRSFFDDYFVAHINIADPFCPDLSRQLLDAVQKTKATTHEGSSFITIEGPRFSTRVESNVFRAWGMSIIGMTASPEAFLAREAEICYAVMAHVTDYDVWHLSEEPVTVEMVINTLHQNAEIAQEAVGYLAKNLSSIHSCACNHALADAIITSPELINPETRTRLSLFIDKYLA